jgi:hypothetical protein
VGVPEASARGGARGRRAAGPRSAAASRETGVRADSDRAHTSSVRTGRSRSPARAKGSCAAISRREAQRYRAVARVPQPAPSQRVIPERLLAVSSQRAVRPPARAPVEGLAQRVVAERPEQRQPITVAAQRFESDGHQRCGDTRSPRRWVDRQRVDLAQSWIDRISTRADSDQHDDRALALRNPPERACGRRSLRSTSRRRRARPLPHRASSRIERAVRASASPAF